MKAAVDSLENTSSTGETLGQCFNLAYLKTKIPRSQTEQLPDEDLELDVIKLDH
jgi:hypothetical protein